MAKINELSIEIFEDSDEPGYSYDIYNGLGEDAESIDGGFCTTTIENALDMAYKQAKDILRGNKL